MDKLRVDLGVKSYDIYFSDKFIGLAQALQDIGAPKKLLIVTDTNVKELYADEVSRILGDAGL